MVHQMMLVMAKMIQMVHGVGGCCGGHGRCLIPIIGRMVLVMMVLVQQRMSRTLVMRMQMWMLCMVMVHGGGRLAQLGGRTVR